MRWQGCRTDLRHPQAVPRIGGGIPAAERTHVDGHAPAGLDGVGRLGKEGFRGFGLENERGVTPSRSPLGRTGRTYLTGTGNARILRMVFIEEGGTLLFQSLQKDDVASLSGFYRLRMKWSAGRLRRASFPHAGFHKGQSKSWERRFCLLQGRCRGRGWLRAGRRVPGRACRYRWRWLRGWDGGRRPNASLQGAFESRRKLFAALCGAPQDALAGGLREEVSAAAQFPAPLEARTKTRLRRWGIRAGDEGGAVLHELFQPGGAEEQCVAVQLDGNILLRRMERLNSERIPMMQSWPLRLPLRLKVEVR